MHRPLSILSSLFIGFIAPLAAAAAPATQPADQTLNCPLYLLTPINAPGRFSINGLNDLGHALLAFHSRDPIYNHSAIWHDGTLTYLQALDDDDSVEAKSINNLDQVCGATWKSQTQGSHAFLWHDGKMTDLGATPDADSAWASAINDAGQIALCIYSQKNGFTPSLFLDGKIAPLAPASRFPNPQDWTVANNLGQFAFLSKSANGSQSILEWDGSRTTERLLSTTQITITLAGLSASNHLAATRFADNRYQPFILRDAKPLTLPLPHGNLHGFAASLNDLDQIVGSTFTNLNFIGRNEKPDLTPVLWENDAPIPLHALLGPDPNVRLTHALKINNAGEIIAQGVRDGRHQTFLLTLNPAFARLVLTDPAAIDPLTKARIADLVNQLDSPDFNLRQAATRDLIALGHEASFTLRALDRSTLTAEQTARLTRIIHEIGELSPAQIDCYKINLPFLLSCLYLEDPALRAPALAQLEKLAKQTLGPDPKGTRSQRLAPLAEIRRKVFNLPKPQPFVMPPDAVDAVYPKDASPATQPAD